MDTTKIERGENTGVIIGPDTIRATDFVAGQESGVVYEERNPAADWEKYKPTDERQSRIGALAYDSNSCVTFSGLNIIETQLNWLLKNNKIPAELVNKCIDQGHIDENGNFNYSDWFSAATNGTNPKTGNTLQAFWDGVKEHGLLPQKDGYTVEEFTSAADFLDQKRITPEMRVKAKLFKEFFNVQYEWVVLSEPGRWDKFLFHVKHAPLHIATPTCGSWNSPEGQIIMGCGDYKTLNHATAYIGQVVDDFKNIQYHKDLDHYVVFVKRLSPDYWIPFALKGVVSVKKVGEGIPVVNPVTTYVFRIDLKQGDPAGGEVRKMQEALQHINSHVTGKPYMTPGNFGPYGVATAAAVKAVQVEHGIKGNEGRNFGPATRKVVNEALSASK